MSPAAALLLLLLLLLSATFSVTDASPTLLATPGVIAGFGFENSSPADSTNMSAACTVFLGDGQFALPSSQCVYGSCMLLNNTAINCSRPSGGFSTQAQPYTVAAWLSPHISSQITATELFFNVFDNASNALEFGINSYGMIAPNSTNNVPLLYENGDAKLVLNGSSYAFPFASAPSNWTHVAFVFNGAYVRLYINATLQSVFYARTNLTLAYTPYTFGIGSRATWGGQRTPFRGFIDELGVFNIALNQSQIFALYSVTNSPPTAAPTAAPSAAPTANPTSDPSSVPTSEPTSSSPSIADYFTNEGTYTAVIWATMVVLSFVLLFFCGRRFYRRFHPSSNEEKIGLVNPSS
jgi:Concanavalin A-like lectin/glucanases superfamily